MEQAKKGTRIFSRLYKTNWKVQIVILLILALMPLLAGNSTLNLLISVFLMGVFAMSYDILLGYTGVISFGHALFFGVGAYSVSIMISQTAPTIEYLLLGIAVSVVVSIVLSLFIGFLSLRVKNTYYAMITLAFAQGGIIIAEKARSITNGTDGMNFRVPSFLIDKATLYYIILAFLVLSFIFLWKFTTSPTGRVLVAIRENEQRVKFLGFNVLKYKLISTVVAGVIAGLAGSFYAIFMRFVSNTDVLAASKTIDALLATIIGGVGTLYGPILGAGIVKFAGEYLSKLVNISSLFDRWYILFGLFYIVIVLFAPYGILGLIPRIKAWIIRTAPKIKNKTAALFSKAK